MNGPNGNEPGVLDSIGRAVLHLDTRWLIVGAVGLLVFYCLFFYFKKGRLIATDDFVSLALTFLQLYSATAIFCTFVLTKPPAIELISEEERQSAGLLAALFLVASALAQIKKVWADLPKGNQSPPGQPSTGSRVSGGDGGGRGDGGSGGH